MRARRTQVPSSKSPFFHLFQTGPGFLQAGVRVRAVSVPGRVGDASVFLELFGGEVADIGLAFFNEAHSIFIHRVEIVGGPIDVVAPVVTEPFDVFLDGVDIFNVFSFRVGVVKAQVAFRRCIFRRCRSRA